MARVFARTPGVTGVRTEAGREGAARLEVKVVGDALQVTVDRHWAGRTCAELLAALQLPAGFVRRLLAMGAVRSGGRTLTAEEQLASGQRLWLEGGVEEADPWPLPANQALAWPPVHVLFEDDHQLVVDKPAGLLVYPGSPADADTLAHRVALYYQGLGVRRRVRHVHRLDRDTTGVLLYAKHAYSARALDQELRSGAIQRVYWAMTTGRLDPPAGTIAAPIGRDRHVSGRYRVFPGGKPAVTHYRTLACRQMGAGYVSLVECRLATGRTHQIRVHLAAHGCPLLGDRLYGGGPGTGAGAWPQGHALHAVSITWTHLYTGERVTVQAPCPPAWAEVWAAWGWQQ
ncbi:MAG: RluA family pseudouridine synthase [Alicyclobacillus sp.]|nr:RluA family pseudouridine synthase [Alicyclobacillus sp.]